MIETGGPAFPTPRYERGDMYSLGMTLRDYFAAKAMQAIVDSSQYQCGGGLGEPANLRGVAEDAYAMSDAMLAARSAT